MLGHFFFFFCMFENFYEYFSFSLTLDPMRAKLSKRYSSYKSQPKAFKLFLNFLPNGPHKTSGIFEILKIEILTIFSFFLDMGPYGSKISKRYSYKSQPKVFKLLLIFFFQYDPHKTALGIFKIKI